MHAPAEVDRTRDSVWPALPLAEWQDTYATLHMWTQIVGKMRLASMPMINHWWQVTLLLTARGLTTGPMAHGDRTFQIDFDFISHELVIAAGDGGRATVALKPRSVADFYGTLRAELDRLGLAVTIRPLPVEVPDAIPFDQDHTHAAYDADAANRFWRILAQSERVMQQFRGRFTGKVSPVHFFWGSFDLAVTRFSGRTAPLHGPVPYCPSHVVHEAYSHEVSSAGFWPGGGPLPEAMYYAYAYPQPASFASHPVLPAGAYYHEQMGEFVLPYAAVRAAADPDATLLAFLQRTYEAAAIGGDWDRQGLER